MMGCRKRGTVWIKGFVAGVLGSLAMPVVVAQTSGPSGAEVRPRPGLTAEQTKRAVQVAAGAMQELRKKTEGASNLDVDPREYVVNVEMLAAKVPKKPARDGAGITKPADLPMDRPLLAVVTTYRYFDDSTVFATIDLASGKVVAQQSAQHIHTALSDAEFEDAKTLAQDRNGEVKRLYDQYGDQLDVYPQFSQFRVPNEERLHRVIHLNYRVGKRDLSYPRPQVDMTTRQVSVPPSEITPVPRVRRP